MPGLLWNLLPVHFRTGFTRTSNRRLASNNLFILLQHHAVVNIFELKILVHSDFFLILVQLLIRTVLVFMPQTVREVHHNIFIFFGHLCIFRCVFSVTRQFMVVGNTFVSHSWVHTVVNLRLGFFLEQVTLWLLLCLYSRIHHWHLWNDFNVSLRKVLRRFHCILMYWLFILNLVFCDILFFPFLLIETKQHRLSHILSRLALEIINFPILDFASSAVILLDFLTEPFRFNDSFTFLVRDFVTFKHLSLYWRLLHFDLNYLLFIFWRQGRSKRIFILFTLVWLVPVKLFVRLLLYQSRHAFSITS